MLIFPGTLKEAYEFGLVDLVIEKGKPAENLFDLSVFNNVPEQLSKSEGRETRKPKDYEKALRDAGMTRREAKAVLSEGLKALEDKSQESTETPSNAHLRDILQAEAELAMVI